MESDKMYYVPDITQLFVGYICEIYKPDHPKLGVQGYWKQVKIGDIEQGNDIIPITRFRNLKKENRIRTKYLDEEDIISLGWKKKTAQYFVKDNYYLYFYSEINSITISYKHLEENEEIGYDTLFQGICNSINELKKVIKFINI